MKIYQDFGIVDPLKSHLKEKSYKKNTEQKQDYISKIEAKKALQFPQQNSEIQAT